MFIKRNIGIRRSDKVRRESLLAFISKVRRITIIEIERVKGIWMSSSLGISYLKILGYNWYSLTGMYVRYLLLYLDYDQIQPAHKFMCRLIESLIQDKSNICTTNIMELMQSNVSQAWFKRTYGLNHSEMKTLRRLL